jgi:hypothetical protein
MMAFPVVARGLGIALAQIHPDIRDDAGEGGQCAVHNFGALRHMRVRIARSASAPSLSQPVARVVLSIRAGRVVADPKRAFFDDPGDEIAFPNDRDICAWRLRQTLSNDWTRLPADSVTGWTPIGSPTDPR